jgi:hypothetical protein
MTISVMHGTEVVWTLDLSFPQQKDPFFTIDWHPSGNHFGNFLQFQQFPFSFLNPLVCASGTFGVDVVSIPIQVTNSGGSSSSKPKFEFGRPEIHPLSVQAQPISVCILNVNDKGKTSSIVAFTDGVNLFFHGEKALAPVSFSDSIENQVFCCRTYSIKNVFRDLLFLAQFGGDLSCYDLKTSRLYSLGSIRDVLGLSTSIDVISCYDAKILPSGDFLVLLSIASKFLVLRLNTNFVLEGDLPSLRLVKSTTLDSFGDDVVPSISVGKKLVLVSFDDRLEVLDIDSLERKFVFSTASEYDLIADGKTNGQDRAAVLASISADDSYILHCTKDMKYLRRVVVGEALDRENVRL